MGFEAPWPSPGQVAHRDPRVDRELAWGALDDRAKLLKGDDLGEALSFRLQARVPWRMWRGVRCNSGKWPGQVSAGMAAALRFACALASSVNGARRSIRSNRSDTVSDECG